MTDHTTPSGFQPIAGLLAAALPGAGHVYLGQARRGIYAGVGILGMFFGGILVGGIDVIDRREDPVWFIGQAFVGPLAFGVDYVHQTRFKVKALEPVRMPGTTVSREVIRSAGPNEGRDPRTGAAVSGGTPPARKSIGKVNELGTLFATIAGMINAIVIIDAAFPGRRRAKGVGESAATSPGAS